VFGQARQRSDESGQASVDLVAALPFLILGVAVAMQLALVGFTAWSAGNAARAAARAAYVGSDPAAAARAALPATLAGEARVETAGEAIEVELAVPRLIPLLPRLALGSSTRLGPDDGSAAGDARG
jgi:pilus assembly protein CpaE